MISTLKKKSSQKISWGWNLQARSKILKKKIATTNQSIKTKIFSKKIIFSTYLTSVKEPKIRKGNSLREPGFGFSMHEINTFITIVNIESKNLQKYSSNNSQRNLITSTSAG
jgi:hypothetical protein